VCLDIDETLLHSKEIFQLKTSNRIVRNMRKLANDDKLMKIFTDNSEKYYNEIVLPSTIINKQIGNTYTASIFFSLLSLINEKKEKLVNCNIGMFGFGSGICSAMFVLHCVNSEQCKKQINNIVQKCNIKERLSQRIKKTPEHFHEALDYRELRTRVDHSVNENFEEFVPVSSIQENLFPNTYYLSKIDKNRKRYYQQYTVDNDDKKCDQ